MFVSHARVRIVGLGGRTKKRGPHRRRLAVKEVVRMPCLLPASVTVVLGLIAVAGGAGMSAIGYIPSHMSQNMTQFVWDNVTSTNQNPGYNSKFYTLKICSYIGPVVMAIGMFAMIVACVFYCEILDKYAILVPDKRTAILDKNELYEVIVGEMKKSYAQSLVTAYSKAAERNICLDTQSSSGDYLPDTNFPLKFPEPLSLEQQIDLECEGYTPSPPIPNKSYSVIQARIQRLRSEDNWLKTSSLPNIRRSTSFKRAVRVGAKIVDSRTLSYDYTMDEARLRRKSMMLRSIVHWNSGSSELFSQRQRRFSSVKVLPSDIRRSFEDLSQPRHGSFPLTRLIQRRGTFACGDMRTRRMKFLLLLEASESLEGFNEHMLEGRRPEISGIRRNSFVPYTTCDKFIAGEERKTSRDRRRSSVNPFSFGNRFGNTIPQPGTRRHSFFPIRRDDKIYVSDPNEQRRHSFNPVRVNHTLKAENTTTGEGRRGSVNPESLGDRTGDRRSLHVPAQDTRFLQIPGLDTNMEGRPSDASHDILANSQHSLSAFSYVKPGGQQITYQNGHESKRAERRHSFNPVARCSSGSAGPWEGTQIKVPKITVSEDLSPTGRYLVVPSQDFYIGERERRHSFKNPPNTTALLRNTTTPATTDRQRISFQFGTHAQSAHSSLPVSQTTTRPTLRAFKPSSEPVSLWSYSQEMAVIEPRVDSRSASPCSNVSCYGSEDVRSELSVSASRTTSISSDRSTKTIRTVSPLSVVAGDGVSSYGTFHHRGSSLKVSSSGSQLADRIPKKPRPSLLERTTMEFDFPLPTSASKSGTYFVRKAASVRDSRERHGTRHKGLPMYLPGSTLSGPATLYPSAITDANAAIKRSKSASALPRDANSKSQSHKTAFSYATVPHPPSPIGQIQETDTKS